MKIASVSSFLLFQLFNECLQVAHGKESPNKGRLFQGLKKRAAAAAAVTDPRILPAEGNKKAPKVAVGKGAKEDDMCSVCFNGAPVGNPNVIAPIPFNNVTTCSEFDSFARTFIKVSDPKCSEAQIGLNEVCGCPPCPGICPNGEALAYPDRIIPDDVNGNGVYDDTCADLNAMIQKVPHGNEACYKASFASEYCGCKSYRPTCTPCYDNGVMTNYSKFIDENATMTCADLAFHTVSHAEMDSLECASAQLQGFLTCGCPSLPPAFESKCTLCYPNETLVSSGLGLTDTLTCDYLNGLTMFSGSVLGGNDSCFLDGFVRFFIELIFNGTNPCCTPKTGKPKKGGKMKFSKEEVQVAESALKSKIAAVKKMKGFK